MNMLQQIVGNTPVWVWAILAFLLYRGTLASVDRETSLKKVFIIPVVMLVLSLQGIVSAFGAGSDALLVWLVALAIGIILSRQLFDRDSIRADPQRQVVFQRGSWIPLTLMMGIFLTKYAVGVTLALHPAFRQEPLFAATICAIYGLFNGIFIGKLLGIVAIYRRAQNVPQLSQSF